MDPDPKTINRVKAATRDIKKLHRDDVDGTDLYAALDRLYDALLAFYNTPRKGGGK